jgi:hypothetical protein
MSEAHRRNVKSGSRVKFKSEIDHAIWCAVLGKPSPWLLDKFQFEVGETFESRFNSGDHQILLWELFDCWRENRPIPHWAGEAPYSLLFGMAKGLLRKPKKVRASWDQAFGRPYAADKQPRGMGTRARMFDVYLGYEDEKKKNKKKPKKERTDTAGLFEKAGKPFGVTGDVAKQLHKAVKDAIKRGYQPITFDLHQR